MWMNILPKVLEYWPPTSGLGKSPFTRKISQTDSGMDDNILIRLKDIRYKRANRNILWKNAKQFCFKWTWGEIIGSTSLPSSSSYTKLADKSWRCLYKLLHMEILFQLNEKGVKKANVCIQRTQNRCQCKVFQNIEQLWIYSGFTL